jgi:hypothetical protein
VEDRRVTVREAAILLGVSEGAVRKRVDRETLEHGKGADGRVYVYLPDGVDNGQDASTTHESGALISEMKERIGFLEEELRRKDTILLNMTEAMKALNPPQETAPEPRESSVIASEERGGGDDVTPEPREEEDPETVSAASTEEGEGVETPLRQEHRSWWRRLFGP